jgi:hypothetical protein
MNVEITENVTLNYDFNIDCGVCGSKLDAEVNRYNVIVVEPCKSCLEESYQEGQENIKES